MTEQCQNATISRDVRTPQCNWLQISRGNKPVSNNPFSNHASVDIKNELPSPILPTDDGSKGTNSSLMIIFTGLMVGIY